MPHVALAEPLTGRIVLDPKILVGKPVIRGTRIAVEFVLELLGDGWPEEDILNSYPGLTKDDLRACCYYASELLSEERIYPRD